MANLGKTTPAELEKMATELDKIDILARGIMEVFKKGGTLPAKACCTLATAIGFTIANTDNEWTDEAILVMLDLAKLAYVQERKKVDPGFDKTTREALIAGVMEHSDFMNKVIARANEKHPKWKHVKSKITYEEVGKAELQMTFDLVDGSELVILKQLGSNGKLWARDLRDFEDGRFVKVEE